MAAAWASIVKGIAALIKPLILFFVYMAGRKAEATHVSAEAHKAEAELKGEYADAIVSDRNADATLGKLRSGEY